MTDVLTARDYDRLKGVHPSLIAITAIARMHTAVPFFVTEGVRSEARQRELVARGASQTMNSKHLTGHAVDLAASPGGELSWNWELYEVIAAAMKSAAETLQIPLTWGGDWKTLKDGPHFELAEIVRAA